MEKSTDSFSFKEVDIEGLETLDAISGAKSFNRWIFDTISPFCNGKILEIGSGIGNISSFFIQEGKDITLSDIRTSYCNELKHKFKPSNPQVELIDIAAPNFETKYKHLLNSFDSVFALNVIEHIKDDQQAIDNCMKLLKKGGHLIILVPAYQILYNEFDVALEHFRRYNKKGLNKLFKDFYILKSFHFNFVAIFGWFVTGKLMRKKTIPSNQMKLFNSLIPIIKLVDKALLNKVGISVITVGKKL